MVNKVYGIYSGSVHEGGGVETTLYTRLGEAIATATLMFEEKNREVEEMWNEEDDVEERKRFQWKEIPESQLNSSSRILKAWTDDVDIIMVQLFNVK